MKAARAIKPYDADLAEKRARRRQDPAPLADLDKPSPIPQASTPKAHVAGDIDRLIFRARQRLAPNQSPRCPACRASRMTLRANANQTRAFWSCARFPKCRGTRNVDMARFRAFAA